MAAEQIRSDSRTEKWFGPRRTILTSAQVLRFFPESPAALPMLLFQCHATAKMRGCLSLGPGLIPTREKNHSSTLASRPRWRALR